MTKVGRTEPTGPSPSRRAARISGSAASSSAMGAVHVASVYAADSAVRRWVNRAPHQQRDQQGPTAAPVPSEHEGRPTRRGTSLTDRTYSARELPERSQARPGDPPPAERVLGPLRAEPGLHPFAQVDRAVRLRRAMVHGRLHAHAGGSNEDGQLLKNARPAPQRLDAPRRPRPGVRTQPAGDNDLLRGGDGHAGWPARRSAARIYRPALFGDNPETSIEQLPMIKTERRAPNARTSSSRWPATPPTPISATRCSTRSSCARTTPSPTRSRPITGAPPAAQVFNATRNVLTVLTIKLGDRGIHQPHHALAFRSRSTAAGS